MLLAKIMDNQVIKSASLVASVVDTVLGNSFFADVKHSVAGTLYRRPGDNLLFGNSVLT